MQNIAIPYFFTITIYRSSTSYVCCHSLCLFCCYSICLSSCYSIHSNCNFITLTHWSISNTFQILTILTNTCARIPIIIFFALAIISTLALTCFVISFLFWIVWCTIEFALTVKWDKTLQLPVHLFKLIMNE